jgi:predicted transposase/invertase (TIGR01784 family)
MRFINPKTDFAFKKIFGSDRSKDILISFLNALLYRGEPVIADLEILDPYIAPKIEGLKDTFVDVRARLRDGRRVIIEMQVLNVEGFEKRVLYNAAKSYSTQLLVGEAYQQLAAVVALTITDFVMFPECDELESVFVLKERVRMTDYREGDMQLVFVELPKFTKELDELETPMDKWLYFLRNAPGLEVIPETMETSPEMRHAFEIANQANMTPEELHLQERKMIYIHDTRNAIVRAAREAAEAAAAAARAEAEAAAAIAEAKAVAEASAKAHADGHADGQTEMARQIARRLLSQMDDAQIAEITGLSLEEVAALRTLGLTRT